MSNRPTNLLLASLSAADLKLLEPHLRPLELKQHKVLFEAGESVSAVYSPYDAIVSLVVMLSTGEMIEAAMVGRDGVIGALAALDGRISFSRAVVQISGHGAICDVEALKRATMQSATLQSLLIRHEQVVYAQAQQTAACNAMHTIEERLARWLLRAREDARCAPYQRFHSRAYASTSGVFEVRPGAHPHRQSGRAAGKRLRVLLHSLQALRHVVRCRK
jgi:CRP-like cAMP-binding protein